MTTLILSKSDCSDKRHRIKSAIDWGTGKPRIKANRSGSFRLSGTFLHSGEPISQTYRNTDLTLSNLRTNDELVPAPLHTTNITSHELSSEFPSNHPFASHISDKAVFPTATVDLHDRPSTCTDPYVVTHKIRGNPFRREVHYYGFQQEHHRASKWPDKHRMQLSRSLSNTETSSSIYPWPRKIFAPNNKKSIPNSSKNNSNQIKERHSLETTYQSNYSNQEGLASHIVYDETIIKSPSSNEQLKPHFNETFQSTIPIEDMQTIHMNGNHQQSTDLEQYYAPIETIQTMSLNEKLDDHLRNGTDYINFPEHVYSTQRAQTWIPEEETLNYTQVKSREIRYLDQLRPTSKSSQLLNDHYASHRQMDAENRLQQLEVIRPTENINLLNVKLQNLQHPRHARPILPQYRDDYVNTLYDQMGTYVQERSGLYHTQNYDPNVLTQAIPDLEYQQENTTTENDVDQLLNTGEQIQSRATPVLFQRRALGDYQNMRNHLLRNLRVPHDASTVDSRTQEGKKQFVQRVTIYGQAYNTKKFLQENTLLNNARIDPSRLMSTTYNNDLERVRSLNSFPMRVISNSSMNNYSEFPNANLVSPVIRPSTSAELYKTNSINEHTNGYLRRPTVRVYDSPFKTEHNTTVNKVSQQQTVHPQSNPSLQIPSQIPRSVKTNLRLPGPEVVARFTEPNIDPPTTYQRSYKDISYHETIPQIKRTTKNNHQDSNCSSNILLRECKLLDLQEQWTKTQAQQQYHIEHPEAVPYVGASTMRAKKEILIADAIAKKAMMTVR
ncbi:unnamed protein product [Rotaria magnacalcarata]|uniref:Uncharacterized protein n=1 Tax=Rotaria magnacalcarata TaxID=392030 RepID=A0A816AK29_9BILA|nr:unnamed protein product [Rotaria magnacalcarata]